MRLYYGTVCVCACVCFLKDWTVGKEAIIELKTKTKDFVMTHF